MTQQYRPPRLLTPEHIIDKFECRSIEQTLWLHRHARQASSISTSKVLVVTQPESKEVVAYYAWSMASLQLDRAPARMKKGAGRYPQPVALLARLGVSIAHEGQGLGAALLKDVVLRAAELGTEIGCRGLLIHAETTEARNFYLHLIPELEPSPTDELHLVLLMKDIHRTLRE